MMTQQFRTLVLLAAVAGAMTACRKKPETAAQPVQGPQTPTPPPTPPSNPPVSNPNTTPTGPTAEEIRAAIERVKTNITATIYFDYDKSDLTADARRILDEKVPALQQNPMVRIRVIGHTDERGSDEYNQALGQRRAAAARLYLTQRGIADGRIDVVSMGESRPAVMGEGETQWSRNRRDEFEIVAGADQIRAPGSR
jgi:peptidoglycan-associated lipoprotein